MALQTDSTCPARCHWYVSVRLCCLHSKTEPERPPSWILLFFSVTPVCPSAPPFSCSAHKLSNISFTPGLQNTNPPASHGSLRGYLSTIKSHVPRSSIYLLSPPLHDFHLLVFDSDLPRLRSCDPITTLCTLFGSPNVSFLPFRLLCPHPHTSTTNPPPPPPPPLFLSIPGFIPSSLICLHPSNPHLFLIGAAVEKVSGGKHIRLCVIPKVNEREKVWREERAKLMITSRGRLLEQDWLQICQNTSRGGS